MNNRKFKETNKSVTESLTSLQMTKLKDARDKYGFKKIWTSDGRIMVMEEGSAKPKLHTLESMIVLSFTLWKKT